MSNLPHSQWPPDCPYRGQALATAKFLEKMKTMRKQRGFSLIELLIVVAIILIIAAIAIPNLLRSRIAANEASAVGTMRSINTAEVTYASTYPDIGFSASLTTLGGAIPCSASSTTACLVDEVVANSGTTPKSGYTFAYTPVAGGGVNVGYGVVGEPATRGQSGQRGFFTDQSGVIRYNASAAATNASNPLQ